MFSNCINGLVVLFLGFDHSLLGFNPLFIYLIREEIISASTHILEMVHFYFDDLGHELTRHEICKVSRRIRDLIEILGQRRDDGDSDYHYRCEIEFRLHGARF